MTDFHPFPARKIIENRINFGAFTIHKLLHLDKDKDFTWSEETITEVLNSQISGYPYRIESACPEHGEGDCPWFSRIENSKFDGNIFKYTKHKENKYTGADFGMSLYREINGPERYNLLFQAKRITQNKSLLGQVKKIC